MVPPAGEAARGAAGYPRRRRPTSWTGAGARGGRGRRRAGAEAGERDALFREAAEACIQNQGGSTSLLQRRLRIGYGRAARIIDQLHYAGILGPPDGSKPREVLDRIRSDGRVLQVTGTTRGTGASGRLPGLTGASTALGPRCARDDLATCSCFGPHPPPRALPAQSDAAERLVGGHARRHAADERSGDPHRPLRRPAHRLGGQPARLRVGARAIPGRGRDAPAKSRSRMPGLWLERSARRPRCRAMGVEFSPARRGAAVLHRYAARRPHRTAGGRRSRQPRPTSPALGAARAGRVRADRDRRASATSTASSGSTTRRRTSSAARSPRARPAWCTCPRAPTTPGPPQRLARPGTGTR